MHRSNMIGGRERAKHIDIRNHFVHEVAQLCQHRLKRVSTRDQLADVFTKSLQPKQPAACTSRLLSRPWPDSQGTSVLTRGNVILSASSQSPRRGVFGSDGNSSFECSTDLLQHGSNPSSFVGAAFCQSCDSLFMSCDVVSSLSLSLSLSLSFSLSYCVPPRLRGAVRGRRRPAAGIQYGPQPVHGMAGVRESNPRVCTRGRRPAAVRGPKSKQEEKNMR